MKEFKMKLQIDTSGAVKEINGTISTISGFEKQITSLQTQLNNTKIGTEEYKNLEKELNRTQKGLEKAKDANKSWLDVVAGSPGIIGTLGKSIQGVGKLFGNLDMALKTSLIGFIAGLVVQLISKFKSMAGVMDPLLKITNIFSATMGRIANVILPIVVKGVEALVSAVEGLFNIFGSLTGAGKGFGDTLGEIAESMNQLEDSEASFNLEQAKSNRLLLEARERAADANVPIQDRIKALQDAALLEEDISKKSQARDLERARNLAAQMAAEMGYNKQKIDEIRKYDQKQLESFAMEIDGFKKLNREKSNELFGFIGKIEEAAAQQAKIGKKTQGQIKALEKEEQNTIDQANKEKEQKAKDAAQKREQERKQELEKQKQGLDAAIELEKNKANTDENILRDLLERKDKLQNEDLLKEQERLIKRDKNQTEAEKQRLKDIENILELQRQKREQSIKAEAKTDLDEEKKKQDEKLKAIKDANDKDIKLRETNLKVIKTLYGEDSEAYKNAQIEINKARQKAIEDEINFIKAKGTLTEEDKARLEDLKLAAIDLFNTVTEQNKKEIESGVNKNKEKLEKQKELDKAEFEYQFEKAENDFELQREIIGKQETALDEQYQKDIAAAGNNAEKKREIELNYTKQKDELSEARQDIDKKEYEQQIAIAQGVANALGALSELVGQDTVAGKALGIAQALINTYVGASEVIKAKAVLPEPANTILKIVNVATTIATGLKTVREITAVKVPLEKLPEVRIRKQRGGLLKGPLHQQGGILTPFGELEGGEFVVNRASTMAFRPQLERINALGGGETELTRSVLSGNIGQAAQPPIIKTYVVASEMSSQQELDRVIRDRSKI
jgi:hypothetical protein